VKYKKIYGDLIAKIKMGTLRSGEMLASTRELARLYRCHRFTVMSVCQDLAAEGWIESSLRSRYKVSAKVPVTSSKETSLFHKNHGKNLVSILRAAPVVDLERERFRIEFWGGQPDLNLFPKDEFRRVLSVGLKRTKVDHLNYGSVFGLEPCLKEVSAYLRRSRSLLDKELIMTNGSQEALYLACQCFVRPGEVIAVERKGYPPAWKLFESLGAVLLPIEVDEEGLNTDDLEMKMKKHRIRMIYTTPLHQYPTTVTLSPRRRQSLIRLAEKHSVPILEDDYDHEFHFVGPPPSPLSEETDMALYVCSFSKILFPGARLGVIACAPELREAIATQKFLISRQTDSLAQIGLSAWIRDGGFERHLRRMCRIYEGRHHLMLSHLQDMKTECNIDWQEPNGGMSIWLNLNQDSQKISERAKQKGILFQFESGMDRIKSMGTHLRIGFAGVNESEIKEGMATLQGLLPKTRRKQQSQSLISNRKPG
jgi:GntR family transcriptional regulator/MocR family aminotransferase